VYTHSYTIDGNFTALHQHQKCPEDDIALTNGQAFMTEAKTYKEHLLIAKESKWEHCTCNEFKADQNIDVARYDVIRIRSVACLRHGFFQPKVTVDFQKSEL
jgi:Kyakuja-Dileera-Zisupton transposase